MISRSSNFSRRLQIRKSAKYKKQFITSVTEDDLAEPDIGTLKKNETDKTKAYDFIQMKPKLNADGGPLFTVESLMNIPDSDEVEEVEEEDKVERRRSSKGVKMNWNELEQRMDFIADEPQVDRISAAEDGIIPSVRSVRSVHSVRSILSQACDDLAKSFHDMFEDSSSSDVSFKQAEESDNRDPEEFFEDMAKMPDIDMISVEELKIDDGTEGIFVDPLVGTPEPDQAIGKKKGRRKKESNKSSVFKLDTQPEEDTDQLTSEAPLDAMEEDLEEESEDTDEEAEQDEMGIYLDEDDDLLLLLNLEEVLDGIKDITAEEPVDDTVRVFLETVPLHLESQYAFVDQVNANYLENSIAEFLDALLKIVVEVCNYKDPTQEARLRLDKRKLITTIENDMNTLEKEQRTRHFLDRKVVEYCKRKKLFRALVEESPEKLLRNQQKYQAVVKELDRLLGEEKEMRQTTKNKIEELRNTLAFEKGKSQSMIEELEQLITNTIVREANHFSQRLACLTNKMLERMHVLRTDISGVRLQLIKKQHNYAEVKQKLHEVETIGDDLYVQDFERLRTEITAISKKIEERDNELAKVRRRCSFAQHIIAHMKEQQQMLRNNVYIDRERYAMLEQKKQQARRRLYVAKLKHINLRHAFRNVSFEGGLLDKPSLMKDFDETDRRVQEKAGLLKAMKRRLRELHKKLKQAELKLKTSQKLE